VDITSVWQAVLLGLVEGLTEFIPVSSTGHLILLIDILGFQGPPGKVFEIIIQLGAILAICWLYRVRFWQAVIHAHDDPAQRRFILAIVIAFLPAAVLGVMFHGFIKAVLFDPLVVATMLVIGGVLIIIIERVKPAPIHFAVSGFSYRLALAIGFCQALAMIPGVSRSGATIMGGLMLGVDRKAATEFSFFLAVPTMLGATVYDSYKNWEHLSSADNWLIVAIGFVSAFLAAMLVVRWVIAFISKHGFIPFAWYRIAVGSVMLVLLLS